MVKRLSSESYQKWQTPQAVFNPLNAEFGFVLDAAADRNNALCNAFYDEEMDAFKQVWPAHGWVWCNCPYYDIFSWYAKARYEVYEAARCPGVVMLLPASISTRWFRAAFKEAEIQLYEGRIAFEKPEGMDNKKRPSFSNALVILRGDESSRMTGVTAMRDSKTGLITTDRPG